MTPDIVDAERDRMQPDPGEIERLGGAADTTGPADQVAPRTASTGSGAVARPPGLVRHCRAIEVTSS